MCYPSPDIFREDFTVNLTLGIWGWTVVLISVGAVLYSSIRGLFVPKATTQKDVVGYALAGRTLTAPLFAATLIATWYGSVLASGEFISNDGIMFLFCFGVPYYLAATAYALVMSRRLRSAQVLSIPESIGQYFGTSAAFAAALAVLVVSIPAPFMLSIGVLLHALTALPLWLCIVIGTSVSMMIVAKGGLRSDVAANVVQVFLMFAGFSALAIYCILAFGPLNTMIAALPTQTLAIPGNIGWTGVLVWMVIALQTFVDPNFFMRTAAANSPDAARRGLLYSVGGWVVFDMLQLTIGLYGVAYVSQNGGEWHFLLVAESVLPDAIKGVFVAALLSSITSALDGYLLSSAATIGHDIVPVVWKQKHGGLSEKKIPYTSLIATGIIGCLVAILVPSIVELILRAASIAVPGLLLPLIASVWKPMQTLFREKHGVPAWLLVVLPSVASAVTMYAHSIKLTSIEPMIVGICCSVILIPFTRVNNAVSQG